MIRLPRPLSSAVPLLALLLPACAGTLVTVPVTLRPAAQPGPVRSLLAETRAVPATGAAPSLPAGLRLQATGTIPQGDVLRPLGREVAVIGQEREEAFPVVRDGTMTGYYLPFEKAYLPLRESIPFALETP